MKRILIVDDLAIFRDPIAASLRLAGYETEVAVNGHDAMQKVCTEPPDLILLDVSMPGMDGLSMLQQIKSNAKLARIPVILLTAVSDKKYILRAARLGARDYLLKSQFSLTEMLQRVKYCLERDKPAADIQRQEVSETPDPAQMSPPAPAKNFDLKIPTLLNRDRCIARTTEALATKTLSGVAAQVVSLAASPRSDAGQIATLVSRDPMLSARVLRVANTAAYASQKGVVTTINEALRNIGMSQVRNIAAAMGIFDAMPAAEAGGFNPIRCWQHSFAVAQLCEKLQSSVDQAEAGVAYLVGLCHDLGEILFHTQFSGEYQQVLEMEKQTGRPRPELEQNMLGITHGELVRTILQHIGLPETIRLPVEAMHKAGCHSDSKDPLARILLLAEMYANGLLLASSMEAPVTPITQSACKLAVGKNDPEQPDGMALRGEVMSLTALLGGLSAKEEQALIQPLFAPSRARVRLVREAGFSSFDPVAAALESIADVTIDLNLPGDQEINDVDAIVVVQRTNESAAAIEQFASRGGPRVMWLVNEVTETPAGACPPVKLPISLQSLVNFVTAKQQVMAKVA